MTEIISTVEIESHFSGNDDGNESIVQEILLEGIANMLMEVEPVSKPVASSVFRRVLKGRRHSELIKLGPRQISVPFPSIAWDQPLPLKPNTQVIGGLVGPAKPTVMEKRLNAASTKTLTKKEYENFLGRPLNSDDEQEEIAFLGFRK